MSIWKGYQRKTCNKGHQWTAENTIYENSGKRRCRICRGDKRRKVYGYTDYIWLKYHLSVDAFEAIWIKQNGVCAICFVPLRLNTRGENGNLVVDHCHKSNRVRGLLCGLCNSGIGMLKDSSEVCQRATEYLRKSETT